MAKARETLGYTTRKNRDWFDSNLESIQTLLSNKHRALTAYLADRTSIQLQDQWKLARSAAERALRSMEDQWWLKLSEQIQGYADAGDSHNFYDELKRVFGPTNESIAPVGSQDGNHIFTNKSDIY